MRARADQLRKCWLEIGKWEINRPGFRSDIMRAGMTITLLQTLDIVVWEAQRPGQTCLPS
jgi:hypothetical protein